MAVRMKYGPNWIGPVGDGRLAVKLGGHGGGHWQALGKARIKIGGYGGGYWYDSGYQGVPIAPSNIWVHDWTSWGYSHIQFAWVHVNTGPTVTAYDIEMLDTNGNWVKAAYNYWYPYPHDNRYQWVGFDVGPSWQFYMRIRSISSNGLKSGWYTQGPNTRVLMGHTNPPTTSTVDRADGWESTHQSGYRNKDDPWWDTVYTGPNGGYIYLSGMHWRNLRFPSGQYISPSMTPPDRRDIEWIIYGTGYGYIHDTYGPVRSGSNIDHALGNWGYQKGDLPNYNWGIVPRGNGWSTGTRPDLYALWCDAFWLSGTEYWTQTITTYHPDTGNSYW